MEMGVTFVHRVKDVSWSDQRGVTSLEYALIASLLSLGVVGSFAWFSPWYILVFSTIEQGLIAAP